MVRYVLDGGILDTLNKPDLFYLLDLGALDTTDSQAFGYRI
jgi:hypothetical protein